MAKAKTGGTRSYIRGRVGSDVYSIGKDAKGNKQQIVRSLAETVANPQTLAQMRGRMIMSTVMQAVSAMSPIVDHSFDNVSAGQPNISEFIRRNYALIKTDVAVHASSGNAFGLNLYGEKGIKQGAYVVSFGKAADLAGAVVDGAAKTLTIALSAGATIADLRSALGLGAEDYFTAVAIAEDSKFVYNRFHITQELAADTAISADNLASVIKLEGNISVSLALSAGSIVATFGEFSANYGIIVSRKTTSGFIHNEVTLAAVADPQYSSSVALPTYPTGAQRFLNGGGESETPVTPVVPTVSIEITDLKTDGNDADVGGKWNNGSVPLEGDASGRVAFTAANVSEAGGAKLVKSTSTSYDPNGQEVMTITDGSNQTSELAWPDGSSVWVVPVNGSPFMLFHVVAGGD